MSVKQQQHLQQLAPAPPQPPQQPTSAPGAGGGPSPPQQQPQQRQPPQPAGESPPAAPPPQPRFEDLTIDDDLPLLPRLQRYVQSSIALQRLVHVRMIGEVAIEIGQQLTATELVPLLPPLVKDGESIIRQRLCSELKVLCLVLMGMTGVKEENDHNGSLRGPPLPCIPRPNKSSKYYKVMTHHLFPHLYALVSDPDNEVRRAASENVVKLALQVDESDVASLALSIPLRLVKEGQKRATAGASSSSSGGGGKDPAGAGPTNPQTPAEDLLITASNLLADLASFLPPPRLTPESAARYLSPTVLALAEDPNFRVRRAAVQALPRMLGSATLDDVKRRLLPKFVALSGDEMYRVRKASGECLVDVSRALGVLPWRVHFADVWADDWGGEDAGDGRRFYRLRTKKQISELHGTINECHEIRRRALCAIAKKLLEDTNKFVRYGMMQFLGPLIASFYPLDRGSMVGGMGGLLYPTEGDGGNNGSMGTLGIGVESVGIAKCSTGLERIAPPGEGRGWRGGCAARVEDVLSYNHSLHGLELILHGESPLNRAVLGLGGGCNANKDPFGTMGPQFFPHANGMVGRSSALDDDDTDSFLLSANWKKGGRTITTGNGGNVNSSSPRAVLPKFILESRSDALALTRIVWHRMARIPTDGASSNGAVSLPYPTLMSGRPDPEDLKSIGASLLLPFIAMASCQTGEETTDAEMRVYCAYSLPAVILLFGGTNWEKDGLKRCFLDLIGNAKSSAGADDQDGSIGGGAGGASDAANANNDPPLPVKRCLASSVHAVAHMLGPDVASRDPAFLTAFEKSFLRDSDEAIRLNVLKNLASFLGALPAGNGPGRRGAYLPALHTIIMGEEVLGAAKRRSASNPGVLNWRQRDAVARALPDLLVLYPADANREFLWPVLRALLTDSVSAVREDAGWSVPVLLRRYTSGGGSEGEASAWISEVTIWLRKTFLDEGCSGDALPGPGIVTPRSSSSRRLKKQMASSEGAFSKRQGYCRILAAMALAMRMGEGEFQDVDSHQTLPVNSKGNMPSIPTDPFSKMSLYERDRFRSILLCDLLPPALQMAADCVANVRLTLTKCLKVLPSDIRQDSDVEEVLSTLEEELMTWDVGDMPLNDANPGGILGGVVSSLSGDPPERNSMGGATVGGVVMTSTMSAC